MRLMGKRQIHNAISNKLEKAGIFAEVEVLDDSEISVLIEWGDWKHEHGYLRYLMGEEGYEEINENITEEDGSDCYSAIHLFKKAA